MDLQLLKQKLYKVESIVFVKELIVPKAKSRNFVFFLIIPLSIYFHFDDTATKRNTLLNYLHPERKSRIIKVCRLYPLGIMNICIKFVSIY